MENKKKTKTFSFKQNRDKELPEWIPAEKLWRYFSSFGISICSFVVNFERQEYHILMANELWFPQQLVFHKMKVTVWESCPTEERRVMANRVERLQTFIAHRVPASARTSVSIVEDYHICWGGMDLLVTQKIFPLEMDEEGHVKVGLFMMRPSANGAFGEMTILWGDRMWKYDSNRRSFVERKKPTMTVSEMKMMQLSIFGNPVKIIADKLNQSENTTKKLRDRMYKKMLVNNLLEAFAKMNLYSLWRRR